MTNSSCSSHSQVCGKACSTAICVACKMPRRATRHSPHRLRCYANVVCNTVACRSVNSCVRDASRMARPGNNCTPFTHTSNHWGCKAKRCATNVITPAIPSLAARCTPRPCSCIVRACSACRAVTGTSPSVGSACGVMPSLSSRVAASAKMMRRPWVWI